MTRKAPGIPVAFIVINAIGSVMLGAGVVGLVEPTLLPQLSRPAIAWSLIGVGLALDVIAVVQLVASRRSVRDA